MLIIRKAFYRLMGQVEKLAYLMERVDRALFNHRFAEDADGIEIGSGAFRYSIDAGWMKLQPGTVIRNCHAVQQSREGTIFVLTDCPANNVIVLDRSGQQINSWTLGFTGAHGLTLFERDEQELLVITDIRSESVVIATLTGTVVQKLNSPAAFGAYSCTMTYMPTETAIGPDNTIYVADGYGAQYILAYSASGEFLFKFGGKGELNFAHGVTVDREGPTPTLLVTSRADCEVHRYSLAGERLASYSMGDSNICRTTMVDEWLLSPVCWSSWMIKPNSGCIDFRHSSTGECIQIGRRGKDTAIFHHCHDVIVDQNGDLLVCQWNANHVPVIRLRRIDLATQP